MVIGNQLESSVPKAIIDLGIINNTSLQLKIHHLKPTRRFSTYNYILQNNYTLCQKY